MKRFREKHELLRIGSARLLILISSMSKCVRFVLTVRDCRRWCGILHMKHFVLDGIGGAVTLMCMLLAPCAYSASLVGVDSAEVIELIASLEGPCRCASLLRLAELSDSVGMPLTLHAEDKARKPAQQASDDVYHEFEPFERLVSWGLDLEWSHFGSRYAHTGKYYRLAAGSCPDGQEQLRARFLGTVAGWQAGEPDTALVKQHMAQLDSMLSSRYSTAQLRDEMLLMQAYQREAMAYAYREAGDAEREHMWLTKCEGLLAESERSALGAEHAKAAQAALRRTRDRLAELAR